MDTYMDTDVMRAPHCHFLACAQMRHIVEASVRGCGGWIETDTASTKNVTETTQLEVKAFSGEGGGNEPQNDPSSEWQQQTHQPESTPNQEQPVVYPPQEGYNEAQGSEEAQGTEEAQGSDEAPSDLSEAQRNGETSAAEAISDPPGVHVQNLT
jgi:hypothetical protein